MTEPVANEDGTLIQYGPNVRMEKAAMMPSGVFMWNVYALEPVMAGKHPTDDIRETTEAAVWVIRGQGDETAAKDLCTKLSNVK